MTSPFGSIFGGSLRSTPNFDRHYSNAPSGTRIAAKPTLYNGIRFRSKSEARFAEFLASISIRSAYEAYEYLIDDTVEYWPDFWLPDLRVFVEVKGDVLDKSVEKTIGLARVLASSDIYVLLVDSDFTTWVVKPDEMVRVDLPKQLDNFKNYRSYQAAALETTRIQWTAFCNGWSLTASELEKRSLVERQIQWTRFRDGWWFVALIAPRFDSWNCFIGSWQRLGRILQHCPPQDSTWSCFIDAWGRLETVIWQWARFSKASPLCVDYWHGVCSPSYVTDNPTRFELIWKSLPPGFRGAP